MNGRELTAALGGRWHGASGEARCPAHEDKTPSLSIDDGDNGRLLTCCHAGCPPEAVWAALQDRGLVECAEDRPARRRRRSQQPQPALEPSPNQDHALEIWRASRDPMGTLTAAYLSHRRITIATPATIRDHPGLKHGPTGQNFPALVAAITGPDRKVIAIQRTFLRMDGHGKANVSAPKLTLGAMQDGAVRLGPAGPVLGIAEGVETGLSAVQLFELSVWCSLSAVRLASLWVPPEVVEIHLFADNGGPGHQAAMVAARAYQAQGRRVVVRFPPERFGDWNDVLQDFHDPLSAEVAA
jgi:putative DNA primase/helicase